MSQTTICCLIVINDNCPVDHSKKRPAKSRRSSAGNGKREPNKMLKRDCKIAHPFDRSAEPFDTDDI